MNLPKYSHILLVTYLDISKCVRYQYLPWRRAAT